MPAEGSLNTIEENGSVPIGSEGQTADTAIVEHRDYPREEAGAGAGNVLGASATHILDKAMSDFKVCWI